MSSTLVRDQTQIVGVDEREQGDRALLNLGHTFGHAGGIGRRTYTRWLHGEASCGAVDGRSDVPGVRTIEAAPVDRLRQLLERVGLALKIDGVPPGVALEHMRIDKKVQSGRMRLVLLRAIGDSFVTADYSEPALPAGR